MLEHILHVKNILYDTLSYEKLPKIDKNIDTLLEHIVQQ